MREEGGGKEGRREEIKGNVLSGRALATQARCPGFIFIGNCWLFTFCLITLNCLHSNLFSLYLSHSCG